MTTATTLILITVDPAHPLAEHAYRYTKSLLSIYHSKSYDSPTCHAADSDHNHSRNPVHVFFYGGSAHTANALRWQVADRENLTQKWQQLSLDYNLDLPVCVSTAITRGITDLANATRHQLKGTNLARGFKLVGLGELAGMLNEADKVIQF